MVEAEKFQPRIRWDDEESRRAEILRLRTESPADAEIRLAALNLLEDAERARQQAERSEEALREQQAWLAAQSEAFRHAVEGAPLATSLGVLVRPAVDRAGTDLRCAFYVATDGGTRLRHVVGLPDCSPEAAEAFRAHAESLARSLTVRSGQPVLTADVNVDPGWSQWRRFAAGKGIRACWSFRSRPRGASSACS